MKTNALKILMLEDSDADAEMIQRTLKKSDINCEFKVMMTKTAFEKSLPEFKPDLILSDNAMPQFSASEALQIVKQQQLHIPFILVTGTVSEEFAASIIKAGADDYLLKDRLTRLPAAIETALKQKQNEKEKIIAAQKLQQSEEKYRSLTERVTDGFVALDKNWNYTYVNKNAGEILRHSPEELIGKNIWTVFPEGAEQPFYKVYHKAFDEQRYIHFEEYYAPFNFWLENHIYPSPDGISIYFRDVTEKKKAEALLHEERDKFTKIAATSPGLIYSMRQNKEGTLSYPYASDAIKEIYGFVFEEITNAPQKIFNLIHPDDFETVKNSIQNTKTNLVPLKGEYRYYHPTKGLIWHEVNSLPVADADGNVVCHGIVMDITERKNAEQKIVKANRLYFFISQINQMIVRTTDETTLFAEICQIAVEVGKFRMAWIGLIDEQTKKVIPVMHAGEESGYLSIIKPVSIDDIPEGRGPVGISLREEKYIICNDIENEPGMAPWREAALARGYCSLMCVPVKKFGKVIGSFSVYATEKNFFDAEEIALLEEATGDVSFALEVFEKEHLRKKAEEAVIKSEQRYHTLTDVSPVGIFHTDATGSTTYVNPRWCEISGLSFEQGIDYGWLDAVHEEDKTKLQKGWEKATGVQELSTSEYRFVHPDGTITWVFGQATPERNTANEVVGYVGTITNITERKKAEELLAANEKRFRKLVENGNDAFAILNQEGKALYVSSSVERVLGYNEEEIAGLDLFTLTHPDDREEVTKVFNKAIDNPGVTIPGYTSRLLHKDGTYHWFEDSVTNLINDPDIGGIVDNFRDVTERIHSQNALKESEEKHRDIVENINDILCTHDLEGNVLSVNATAKKVLGYEVKDMLKMKIQDALLPKSKERFDEYLTSIKKNGFAQGLMYVQTSAGENRIWEFRNTLRTIEGKAPFVYGFAQDVTERIGAEEAIKSSEEKRRLIMNAALDAIICIDIKGLITFWNPQAEKVFGWQENEVMGRLLSEMIIPEPFRKMHEQGMDNYLKTGSGPVLNKLLHLDAINRHGAEFPVELTVLPIKQDGEEFFCAFVRDITERKKAEEAIKASEEQYRTLVEQASDGIFIADNTGKFVIVNTSACNLSGYSPEELKNLTIYDLVDPANLAANPFHFEEMYKPQGARAERQMVCKNGTVLDVEISAKFLSDKRFIAFVRDIGDRLKAEQAIRMSEERYRVLVEEASEGIYISDPSGRFTTVNASACKIAQYSEAELLQMTFYDFFIQEDIEQNPPQFEALRQGKTVITERRMKRKDGGVNQLEITSKLLTDGRLLSLVRDVAERKKAEQALQASEEKYRSLVEQASDAIFIADKNGRFITVNTSACKLSGYTEPELMQMTIYDFVIEEDIKKRAFRFEELKQGHTTLTERVMQAKGGKPIQVEITSKLLSDGRLLSFVRDISERIRAQNEIIKEKNLSDSIINSLPASFFMVNVYGKMLRWNRHMEEASKYNSEEISTMHPLDFFAEEDKEMVNQKMASVFITGEDSMEATVCLKNKETLPYYFKGISIEYDGTACIMGVGIDISERVKAQEEIKQTNEKLRELTNHLLKIREEERKRIGREIHDELGQQLTAIKMDVSWIDKKLTNETEPIKNKLKNIITLLDGSNQSIRRILSELRPGILDDNGLLEALEWLNRQFTAQTGIPVEFETAETELKLPEPLSTCIFRVYQETFTNITRYANASKVVASLTMSKDTLCVKVEDDGNGFDLKSVAGKKSFGILGMKERILALNGNFQLISEPGKGTKVIIILPLGS